MSNELARINTTSISTIPSSEEWGTIYNMAKALLPTGFLPSSIKTPEQATAIMLKGRELNIPPMQALSNIVVVQGKPTVSAELMLALVQRDHGLNAMWVEESTNDKCTVGYQSGNGKKFHSFTIEDAKRAGIAGKGVWSQYPAAMLRARCISAVARMAFPGAIAGMYVPGELGDSVKVTDDGEVVSQITGEIHAAHMEPDKWGNGTGSQPTVSTQEPRRVMVQPTSIPEVIEDEEDEDDRAEAMQGLSLVATSHGYTDEDIEDYFLFSDIDPATVTAKRMDSIAQGIISKPEFFGKWLKNQRDAREMANDPSLNPSVEELGA